MFINKQPDLQDETKSWGISVICIFIRPLWSMEQPTPRSMERSTEHAPLRAPFTRSKKILL